MDAAPPGSGVAPGFSATIDFRSSTSKTRSKDTSAVITSTLTLDSDVSGPYSCVNNAASATTVPTSSRPCTACTPPHPYTNAVASDATSISAAKNTRPYIAVRTPISRTRAALPANDASSSTGRPKIFTSSAPATLNRSVIIEFMAAPRL